MTDLLPGANAPVPSQILSVTIRHGAGPGAEVDMSAFLVGPAGQVRSDADMCFYGQPSVAAGAVALESAQDGETRFAVRLGQIPSGVEKIVFTATVHENKAPFGKIADIALDVGGVRGRIPCAGMTETALILAEIYQRNGAWKVRVIGQGFNGGARRAGHASRCRNRGRFGSAGRRAAGDAAFPSANLLSTRLAHQGDPHQGRRVLADLPRQEG